MKEYYGDPNYPYEVIKVVMAWKLDFCLGNVVKYVVRAGKKTDNPLEDLEKARDYLDYKINELKTDISKSI